MSSATDDRSFADIVLRADTSTVQSGLRPLQRTPLRSIAFLRFFCFILYKVYKPMTSITAFQKKKKKKKKKKKIFI